MEGDKTQAIQRLFEVFAEFKKVQKHLFSYEGIRRSEFHVLLIIKKLTKENQQGVKVLDISREMGIAPPSITLLVNSLVMDGYVERKINEEDRRSVQINLTDKGCLMLEQCKKSIHTRLEGIVDYLGIEKSHLFSDLISEICLYFKEQVKNPDNTD